MFSTPFLLITLSFFFIAQCLAFPLEEAHEAYGLHVRQVASSATATATDVGSVVAGNLLGVLAVGASASSASVAAAATAGGGGGEAAITVTIVQPTLCKTSDVQYSTKTAIPTGQVQVFPDQNAGWGTTGSIWNFTLDDGVEFSQLTASCQGSACTGSGAEQSGKIVKNPDGVWTLNVTANMAPSVNVIGATSGGNPVNGNFDLSITSTPPCALPVAQTCTAASFDPSAQQWDAYSVDSWLANYASTNNIQTFGELYDHVTKDFLVPTQIADLACEPGTGGYSCEPPAAPALALDCSSTQGLLVLFGVIRLSNVLNLLWGIFKDVQSDVSDWVDELVDQFIVPKIKQSWEAIVTAASSIVGILIFFFILADTLAPEAAAPLTGIAVATIVGLTNVIGGVANFANGFDSQPADDTYLKYTGQYDQGVSGYTSYMQASLTSLWRPSDPSGFGTPAVEGVLKGGAWTDLSNPLAIPGLGNVTEKFFDTLLVTTLINQIWKNNDFYIVFVPYGPVATLQTGLSPSTTNETFSLDDCNNHWANDPNRPNYISCSLNYGGTTGMTILTQPSAADGGTLPLAKAAFSEPQINFVFNNDDALQSSLTANADYGFDYNFTTAQLQSTLTAGAIDLKTEFASIPLNAPGLYNLDVCIVTQLSFVSGARQYLKSGNGNKNDVVYPDPCSCASFSSHGGNFVDFATANVKAAVTVEPDDSSDTCLNRLSNGDPPGR